MPAGKIHHLTNLGFRNFVAEHANDRDTFFVNRQHDLECFGMGHAKEPLQHVNHELHRGVVIIEQQNLVQRRPLGLGSGLDQNRCAAFVIGVIRHIQGFNQHQKANPHSQGVCIGAYIYFVRAWKRGLRISAMQEMLTTVAFDADDTLWHNERFFQLTQDRFANLLADHAEKDHLMERLLAAERRNISRYGYGVKGFVLSMIETAMDVTEDRVPGHVVRELIEAGHDMLAHPIELLPHAREAVEAVADTHRVLLITKGDLLDQERKLAQSGLGELFDAVEIVSEKTPQVYHRIFQHHADGPGCSMMVGNSMRSDVLAPLAAGSWGVHVPHELNWDIEAADPPEHADRFRQLADLSGLRHLVQTLS